MAAVTEVMNQVWFRDPESTQTLVAPIEDLLYTKEDWTLSVADVPSQSRVGISSRRNAVVIYKCTKQDLQSQIDALKDTPGWKLTLQASDAMEMAGLSKYKWRGERQTSSTRRAGATFQASMTSFSQFLENFSGIAEIAKSADQQYGGLAYGTLSLMLSVFVHKTQREEALDEGFEELTHACPRLQTLQNLRQVGTDEQCFQRLEALIISTFCLVITFAREVTEYYSSKLRRFKDVFIAEQGKNKSLSEIRRILGEIRHECDVLMLTRITALQHKIDDMSVSIAETRHHSIKAGSQLTRARKTADTTHLVALRQTLGVDGLSPHVNLKDYKDLLVDAFFSENLQFKHYRPREVSMELLRGDGDFDRWWKSPKSCLLIAGGTNYVDDHSSGSLNWLSYGAVLAIEQLRQEHHHIAFFLTQTSLNVNRRKRCSSQQIMAHLIYQIAEMHEDLLRGKMDRLQFLVQSSAWTTTNSDTFMSRIHPLLLDIFSEFSSEEEICIVIDRLDQCEWEVDENGDSSADMRHMIEWLLHVAAKAFCHVKVLLTVDAAASRQLARARNAFHKKDRKALLLKAEWCQVTDEGGSGE